MPVKNARKILALIRNRKARERERRFVVEGIRLVHEALLSEAPVEQLIFDREMLEADGRLQEFHREAMRREITVQQTDRRAIRNMGEHQNPEGVLGVVRNMAHNREQALDASGPLILFDRLRDPNNLGLVLRTAEAAGAAGIFLSPGSVELYNSKVVRASRGSIFRLPVFRNEELPALIEDLQQRGVRIVSTQLRGTPFYEIEQKGRIAFLFGNETFGVDPDLQQRVHRTVSIPMAEGVNSLNVAVAAGILLFRIREPR
ncbi:MAG: RNA methyltransferase [Gemmatimonadota bacterium]|nr:RNA methyltransferase [Gemmatimonadota bacterium]